MKRICTVLMAALLWLAIPMHSWAQTRTEASVTFSELGYENAQDLDGVVIPIDANVNVVFNKANGNNGPKYYNTGAAIRAYAGNTIVITAATGLITGIEFTMSSGEPNQNEVTSDVGSCAFPSWSGSTGAVTFSVGGSSGHRRVAGITVTYQTNSNMVAAPVLSPAGGTFYDNSVTVTATCGTEGATIRYTTNGNDPSESSTVFPAAGLTLTETTTVKARAFKSGMTASSVTSATYTFQTVQMYPNIAAWKAAHTATDATVSGISGDVTAVFQSGTNLFVQDATGGLLIYGTVSNTYNNGDVISGGLVGTSSLYHGLIEFVPTQSPAAGVPGTAVTPVDATAAQIEANFSTYESKLVKMTGIVFTEDHTFNTTNTAGRTAPFTQGDISMNVFDNFKVLNGYEVTAGEEADLIGFVGVYDDTKQINPRSTDDITPTEPVTPRVATPTFSPEAGAYTTAQTVTISCETEGAAIRYTLDGSTPTPNSALYSQPIAVSTNTTIKAIGTKSGMLDSYVATAEYTFVTPITIAEARALAVNDYALVQGVVTLIDGRNVYIQDATAGIDLYLNSNTVPTTLALGDMVMAYGQKKVFNGLVELSGINGNNAGEFNILSTGNPLPLVVKTIAEILDDHEEGDMLQSTRVKVVDAVIGEINTNDNTPITQNGSSINIYKMPEVAGLMEGDNVTVIAVVGCYNVAQLRINSAEDVSFTHPIYPAIAVNPEQLSGFGYVVGSGPSAEQSFTVTGINLESNVTITLSGTAFEMSTASGNAFAAESPITLTPSDGSVTQTVYVRLKSGLTVGNYTGSISVNSQLDPVTLALNGSVADQGDSWNRVYSIGEITDGCQVIIAARYDAEIGDGYYAMPAHASGKPEGELFTSTHQDNMEMLPATIVANSSEFLWNVSVANGMVTFTNNNGQTLGYNSGTDFNASNNPEWTLSIGTAGETAMIPGYTGFVITNAGVTNRSLAMNYQHKFGAYAESNMNNAAYNFYVDLFVFGGEANETVETPVIDKPSGTYFEAFDVTITCATPGATIRYTINGDEPTANSMIYTTPIHVASNMTIKAVAMRENFNNSEIVSASYVVFDGMSVIFNQDWEGEMNGWTFVNVAGNKPWIIGEHNNNHYANANGYGDDVANEQWCISPSFDLTQHAGQDLVLFFLNATKFNGPAMELLFSNNYDGQHPNTATWSTLSYTPSPGNYVWTESGNIDLSGFNGDQCYIAFKYVSTPETDQAAAWEVDDIMLLAGGTVSNPVLNATPTTVNLEYICGEGPSQAYGYSLYAANLVGSGVIMALAPERFEISLDGNNWDSELGISYANGVLTNQPVMVYVRMVAGLQEGTYSGQIEHEGGNAYAVVHVEGIVLHNQSVGEMNSMNVRVWHTDNEIVVENGETAALEMTVYNLLGQAVVHRIIAGESQERCSHALAEGLYIITLKNATGSFSAKMLIK